MSRTDKPKLLSQLARLVASVEQAGKPLESRLCQAYLAILGGDGASLTLACTQPQRVTLCSSDEVATRLEDLQDVLQEGPSQDAYRTGELKVADLDDASTPWPLFTDAARAAVGPVSVWALPMRPNQQVVGVLTVYYRRDGAVPAGDALFLSDAIGAALLHHSTGLDDFQSGPWSTRAVVHQATGMVVEQLHVAPADALALLRAHAYTYASSLADVADRIVRRRLAFSDHDDAENET